jgi:type I restriction enzyme M protein
MLIDARQQYEKEPKSFGNKRNRINDTHRAWIEKRYTGRLEAKGCADEYVKSFSDASRTSPITRSASSSGRFDAHDQPATVTEPYDQSLHRRESEEGAGVPRQRTGTFRATPQDSDAKGEN